MRSISCPLSIQLMLLLDPTFQRTQKRRDHIKAAILDQIVASVLLRYLILPLQDRQIRQFVPINLGNLLASAGARNARP